MAKLQCDTDTDILIVLFLFIINLPAFLAGVHGRAPDHVDEDDVLVVLHLHGAGHQEQDPQRARPPGPLRPRRPQGARHAHVHHGAGHGLQRAQALPAVVEQQRSSGLLSVDQKNLGTRFSRIRAQSNT